MWRVDDARGMETGIIIIRNASQTFASGGTLEGYMPQAGGWEPCVLDPSGLSSAVSSDKLSSGSCLDVGLDLGMTCEVFHMTTLMD